jgi:hypothetical protein
MQQILITFSGGKATVETKGFTGSSCVTATAELEAALGITTGDERKPEFYQRAPVAATQKAGR